MTTVKLKFPVIKGALPAPRALSMNDYLRFVLFNIKYTLDKKVYRNWKKTSGVNVPFVFK